MKCTICNHRRSSLTFNGYINCCSACYNMLMKRKLQIAKEKKEKEQQDVR